MKIRCEYCNNYLDDTLEKCPGCGAPNKNYKRVGDGVPTTIEELEIWYKEHNLPPYETTRFFIGIDYKEPKAFGIYKDSNTGNFVVYKNKDTGERAVRYEGNDEKYAVNELYLKLKEEILHQKSLNYHPTSYYPSNKGKSSDAAAAIVYIFIFIAVMIFVVSHITAPQRGYYNIDNNEYYYVNGDWFIYDASGTWTSSDEPPYEGSLSNYYDGYNYSSNSDYTSIKESSVYDDDWDTSSSSSSWSSSDHDWDSSSSWDSSDSWDSGGSDWSSDW